MVSRARRLGDLEAVEKELRKLLEEIMSFLSECERELGYLDISLRSTVSDPIQEAVEGVVLTRLLKKKAIPTHDELGVPPREYVLGVGDAVGELRRVALHFLLEGKIEEAEELASFMEEIYEGLSRMVFPDSLVPVRRKADMARSLVDRTLSEILLARSSGGKR